MRFWCGDYETDEWVLAVPVEILFTVIMALVGAFIAWRVWEYFRKKWAKEAADDAKKKKEDEEAKAKLTKEKEEAEKQAQKTKDEQAAAKAKADKEKQIADDLIAAKNSILKMVDAKLRELQDGHRSTMISDNYNRISWIAEGVRQARDAVESIKAGDVKP